MPLTIRVKAVKLPKIAEGNLDAAKILREEMKRTTRAAGIGLRDEFREITPVGASEAGGLKNAIRHTSVRFIKGGKTASTRVGAPPPHAAKMAVIEFGVSGATMTAAISRRGLAKKLLPWVRSVKRESGKEAFAAANRIAGAIRRRGLPSARNVGRLGMYTRKAREFAAGPMRVLLKIMAVRVRKKVESK
jgi:hypothetical protein